MKETKNLWMLLALYGLIVSPNSLAQDNDDSVLDEIIVTATGTGIRGVAPVGAATLSMNHEDLLNSTSVDMTSFIAELPQGSGLGFREVDPSQGGNVGFAQGVNLRGLGNNATLVLFDGHRLVGQGVTEQFADPNQLPISAIERVEVVMDAASAVYGSDAIAGVVNFILRDDFEGLEVNARYTDSLYSSTAIDLLGGFNWDSGNVWLGVMHEDRGSFRRNERAFLLEDLTPFGSNDYRVDGRGNFRAGPLPYILADGVVYGVPDTGGTVPVASDILALQDQATISDRGDEIDFQPERQRLAVSMRARQSLFEDRGTLTFTGVYSKRETEYANENVTWELFEVDSTSPYYIDGLTATPGDSYDLGYSLYHNNQGSGAVDVTNRPVEEALNAYLDFSYDLTENWQLTANVTYGDNEGCGRCGRRSNAGVLDAALLDSALSPDNYSDIFNPFITGPQGEFFDLVYSTSNQETSFEMMRYTLKFEGGLFELPGGQTRVAFGTDYEDTSHRLYLTGTGGFRDNPPLGFFVQRDANSDRQVSAAYVETYLPFTEAFEANLAVRYDDYSDVGSTTNSRIGVKFKPIDKLTLRATAATAFRAPTLVESNPDVLGQFREGTASNGANDPNIPITNTRRNTTAVMYLNGTSTGLVPEEADSWTVGFDLSPLDGLRISATYYDVDYENRIEDLPNSTSALATPENRALYDPFIIVAPQPASCVDGDVSTYAAIYQPLFNSPNLRPSTRASDCDLQAIIRAGQQNTGEVKQSGLDLQVSYDWSTDVGEWGVRFNGSKVLDLTRKFLPDSEATKQLDTIGFQNSLRASARLIWRKGNWMTSLDATHVGDYVNDLPITVDGQTLPETRVPSWTTFGANVRYQMPEGEGSGILDGIRVGLSVDNLTDKDPHIVLQDGFAVDNSQHSVFGRIWSVTVQKKF